MRRIRRFTIRSRLSSYKRGNTGLLPKWHHVTVCVAVDVRTVPQRSPVFPWSVPNRLQNAVRFHLEFGNGPNDWNRLAGCPAAEGVLHGFPSTVQTQTEVPFWSASTLSRYGAERPGAWVVPSPSFSSCRESGTCCPADRAATRKAGRRSASCKGIAIKRQIGYGGRRFNQVNAGIRGVKLGMVRYC